MKRTVDELWKEDFDQAFVVFARRKFEMQHASERETFRAFLVMPLMRKSTFWVELGANVGVPYKKLHDYFHSCASKRYCDPFEEAKPLVLDVLQEALDSGECVTRNIVAKIKEQLASEAPDKLYHFATLYQFVNFRVQKHVSAQRQDCCLGTARMPEKEKTPRKRVRNQQVQATAERVSLTKNSELDVGRFVQICMSLMQNNE